MLAFSFDCPSGFNVKMKYFFINQKLFMLIQNFVASVNSDLLINFRFLLATYGILALFFCVMTVVSNPESTSKIIFSNCDAIFNINACQGSKENKKLLYFF
jgi:hypothetical protein